MSIRSLKILFPIRFLFISKRISKLFIYTLVWLSIPLLFYIPKIKSEISYNESFLTPYSVSVSGYVRNDGTIVQSYKRRPPGSVINDKPFEERIDVLNDRIMIIYSLFFISIIVFLYYLFKELRLLDKNFEKYIHSEITLKINLNLSDLYIKPTHLINRNISRHTTSKIYNCVYCKKTIEYNEFHHSSLAKTKPQKTCKNCMLKMQLKFRDELFYIDKFESKLQLFVNEYENILLINFKGYKVDKNKIENYFYKKIKESRISLNNNFN